MDKLKEKTFGLLVIIALAVIFIPMIFESADREDVAMTVKAAKKTEVATKLKPSTEKGIVFKEESRTISPDISAGSAAKAVEEPAEARSEASVAQQAETTSAEKHPEVPLPITANSTPSSVKKATPPGERKGWTLQLGSFADVENAKQLVQRLKLGGYPAYFNTVYLSGQIYSVVYVGPYVRKSDPERLKHILESSFKVNGTLIHYETQ